MYHPQVVESPPPRDQVAEAHHLRRLGGRPLRVVDAPPVVADVERERLARRDLFCGRLAVNDLDREPDGSRSVRRSPPPGCSHCSMPLAPSMRARRSSSSRVRTEKPAPTKRASRRSMHAVAVRRGRGPAHVEDVVRTAREREAEVGEEGLRARDRAARRRGSRARRLGRRVRVPCGLCCRLQLVHRELLAWPVRGLTKTRMLTQNSDRQVDKTVQHGHALFMVMHKARRKARPPIARGAGAQRAHRDAHHRSGPRGLRGNGPRRAEDRRLRPGRRGLARYVLQPLRSVEELLDATSEWTTRELIETIEAALEGVEGPALRFGVGLRLFFAKAQPTPSGAASSRACGGRRPRAAARDLEEGLRLGVFRRRTPRPRAISSSASSARRSCGSEASEPPRAYGAEMTELCLQALGTDSRRIAAVMKHELPLALRAGADAHRDEVDIDGTRHSGSQGLVALVVALTGWSSRLPQSSMCLPEFEPAALGFGAASQ